MALYTANVTYQVEATAYVEAKNKAEALELIRTGQYDDLYNEDMVDTSFEVDETSLRRDKT